MARKTEQCLSYFSLDTDFFFNPKILALTDKFGIKGVYLLLYIYCAIYGNYGYYMVFDYSHISFLKRYGLEEQDINDILNHLRKYGFLKVVNLNPDTVFGTCDRRSGGCARVQFESPERVTIDSDQKIGSIDKTDIKTTESLITDDGLTTLLITGRSIQEQFCQSVSKLSKKFTVDANLWLLPPSQTSNSITVSDEDLRFPDIQPLDPKIYELYVKPDDSPKNSRILQDSPDFSEKLQDSPENSRISVRKGKERKEKRKESEKKKIESDKPDPSDPPAQDPPGKDPKKKAPKKKADPPKKPYGEFGTVMLTDTEYNNLLNKKCKGYQALVDRIIDVLDSYKMANGKRYKSDAGAINKWVYKQACEDMGLDPNNLVIPKPKQEMNFGMPADEFDRRAAEFAEARKKEMEKQDAEWQKNHPNQDFGAENFSDMVSKLSAKMCIS